MLEGNELKQELEVVVTKLTTLERILNNSIDHDAKINRTYPEAAKEYNQILNRLKELAKNVSVLKLIVDGKKNFSEENLLPPEKYQCAVNLQTVTKVLLSNIRAVNVDETSDIRYKDVLLSIPNRRYQDEIFPRILKEVISHKQPISLIIVDIDDFGSINKTHGLKVGDDVLKITANLIKEVVGEKGKVARYGGEEISIILPNYDIEETISLAERIRKSIERYNFNTEGKVIKITISAGVSCCISSIELEDFIKQADIATRISKSKGKNQVTIFDKEQSSLSNESVIIESIKDHKIKEYAKMALEALQAIRLEESAKFIKLTFDIAFHKWKDSYQKESGVVIFKMTIPELIQNNILNFNLVEYAKFEAYLPHITWFENQSHQIQIKRSYTLESDQQNIIFCLKFLLNAIIQFKKQVEL